MSSRIIDLSEVLEYWKIDQDLPLTCSIRGRLVSGRVPDIPSSISAGLVFQSLEHQNIFIPCKLMNGSPSILNTPLIVEKGAWALLVSEGHPKSCIGLIFDGNMAYLQDGPVFPDTSDLFEIKDLFIDSFSQNQEHSLNLKAKVWSKSNIVSTNNPKTDYFCLEIVDISIDENPLSILLVFQGPSISWFDTIHVGLVYSFHKLKRTTMFKSDPKLCQMAMRSSKGTMVHLLESDNPYPSFLEKPDFRYLEESNEMINYRAIVTKTISPLLVVLDGTINCFFALDLFWTFPGFKIEIYNCHPQWAFDKKGVFCCGRTLVLPISFASCNKRIFSVPTKMKRNAIRTNLYKYSLLHNVRRSISRQLSSKFEEMLKSNHAFRDKICCSHILDSNPHFITEYLFHSEECKGACSCKTRLHPIVSISLLSSSCELSSVVLASFQPSDSFFKLYDETGSITAMPLLQSPGLEKFIALALQRDVLLCIPITCLRFHNEELLDGTIVFFDHSKVTLSKEASWISPYSVCYPDTKHDLSSCFPISLDHSQATQLKESTVFLPSETFTFKASISSFSLLLPEPMLSQLTQCTEPTLKCNMIDQYGSATDLFIIKPQHSRAFRSPGLQYIIKDARIVISSNGSAFFLAFSDCLECLPVVSPPGKSPPFSLMANARNLYSKSLKFTGTSVYKTKGHVISVKSVKFWWKESSQCECDIVFDDHSTQAIAHLCGEQGWNLLDLPDSLKTQLEVLLKNQFQFRPLTLTSRNRTAVSGNVDVDSIVFSIITWIEKRSLQKAIMEWNIVYRPSSFNFASQIDRFTNGKFRSYSRSVRVGKEDIDMFVISQLYLDVISFELSNKNF